MTSSIPLERVRRLCLALPETFEKLSHGEPTWFAKKKVFVMFANNHHGDGRIAIWCKAPPGVQAALVAADEKTFFVPPYVGVGGWVGIRLDRRPRWKEVAGLIEQAYQTAIAKGRSVI
jgi:hypothetical protein